MASSIFFILFHNLNLVISWTYKVNPTKHLSFQKLIKQIINSKSWVSILHHHLIEGFIIHTHFQCPILLMNEKDGGAPYHDLLGLMYPFVKSFSNWTLNSFNSSWFIWYGALAGGATPNVTLIAWSTHFLGGNSLGNFLSITSRNFVTLMWMLFLDIIITIYMHGYLKKDNVHMTIKARNLMWISWIQWIVI